MPPRPPPKETLLSQACFVSRGWSESLASVSSISVQRTYEVRIRVVYSTNIRHNPCVSESPKIWRTLANAHAVDTRPSLLPLEGLGTRLVSGTILLGVDGADNAKCTICGVSFSVRHGGANDIVKHFSTKSHWQAVNAKTSSSTLARYGFGHSDEALKAWKKKDE